MQALDDGARMTVPVTDRGDAIGLLELDLPRYPSPAEVAEIASAAHALAYVVIAARRHTDVFEWGQRTSPFALASVSVWTFGALEPTAGIGSAALASTLTVAVAPVMVVTHGTEYCIAARRIARSS